MNLSVHFLIFSLIYFSANCDNNEDFDIIFNQFNENQDIANDNIYFPMTLEYGTRDSDFVQIEGPNSSISTQNCTIKVTHFFNYNDVRTYVNMGIIVVIEVFKKRPTATYESCYIENYIFIEHIANVLDPHKKTKIIQICDQLTYTNESYYGKYVNVFKESHILVHANLRNFFGTVKITATASRNPLQTCKAKSEMSCEIMGSTWCLNKALECNGELNCGDTDQSDENPEICQTYSKKLVVMTLCGLIIVIVMLFIMVVFQDSKLAEVYEKRERNFRRFGKINSL